MKKNWTYKKLGEVCEIVMGQSPDGNTINDRDGTEFHQGKTYFGERYLTHSNLYTSKPSKYAVANSVLLCVRAPVGFPNITKRRICIGRGLCSLVSNEHISNMFLFYSLLGKQAYFEKNSTGSTFKAISSIVISNAIIPLPPLPIQEKIVSELDCINGILDKKRQQLKELDALAQSLFYQMFGDPINNEKGWEVKKLGEVCEITSSKRIFAEEYVESGIPFYRSKEVIEKSKGEPISVELFISEDRYKEVKEAYGVPTVGDILITAVGTIGKIWLVDSDEPFYFKDGNLVWLRNIQQIESVFFKTSLFYLIDEYKKVNANGAAYNALTIVKLKQMDCPLPPLPLQQSFASKIEAIEKQKKLIKQSIADIETLLASRMQYWFD